MMLPPIDRENETAIIGALATWGLEVAPEIFAAVRPGMFGDELAQAVFEAFESSWHAGDPIDPAAIYRRMQREEGHLSGKVAAYLAESAMAATSAANVPYYCRRLAESHQRRELALLGHRLAKQACDGTNAAEEILARTLADASRLVNRDGATGDPWKRWEESLEELDRRTCFDIAPANSQLGRFTIGPSWFSILAGVPGVGKSTLANQIVVNALEFDQKLVALIANVEMDPGTMLDRLVARLSGVPYGVIRDRTYRGERMGKVRQAAELLKRLKSRLHFIGPPFTVARVRAVAAATKADLVIVDYLQRFKPSTAAGDARQVVTDVVSECRELAMSGPGVIGVCALSRQGQLRESSELEYGADAVYILKRTTDKDGNEIQAPDGGVQLVAECTKNRHGAPENIELSFHGSRQEHVAAPEVSANDEFAWNSGGFSE